MAAKHFIAKAIKRPGALTRKAEAAGESPMKFAEEHKGAKGLTGEQSRFAIQLRRMRGKK